MSGGESLERLHEFGNGNLGRDQQVDVIRHNYEIMKIEFGPIAVADGFHDDGRDFGALQVGRAGSGLDENAVHQKEGLAGFHRHGEVVALWDAAVRVPCEEGRLAHSVVMRQDPGVESGHLHVVHRQSLGSLENLECNVVQTGSLRRIGNPPGWGSCTLQRGRLPIGRRLPACTTSLSRPVLGSSYPGKKKI